jgi:hypothetical protein
MCALALAACGGNGGSNTNNDNNDDQDAGMDTEETDGDMQDTEADTEQDTDEDTGPQCESNEELCGETCVDTTSSVDHCGACDSPCPTLANATASCDSGSCTYTCDAGYSDVNGDLSDPANSDGCEANCTITNNGEEACDAVDNDCDGEVDEDFGNKGDSCTAGQGICERTGTYVCTSDGTATECSATAGQPDATETCDGADNDCDGTVDNGCDDDGDGYCDESLSVVGSPAVCSNGTDDCDDDSADVYPDAPGLCDGKDNDCNGETDEIRGIPTTRSSFDASTMSNSASETFPSTLLAAPAGDGFCVYMKSEQDSSEAVVAYMEHGSTSWKKTDLSYQFIEYPEVIDISGDSERCVYVTRGLAGEKVLSIQSWPHATANASVSGETVTSNYYPVDSTNNAAVYNASLRKVTSGGSDKWAVGYMEETGGGNARAEIAIFQEDIENATAPEDTESLHTVDSSDLAFADLGTPPTAGPSPNSNDDYAVIWFHSRDLRFKLTPSSNFNSEFDLATANFGAEVPHMEMLHGVTFYGYESDIGDSYPVHTLANNYTADAEGTLELNSVNSNTKEYYVRDTLTEGPDGTSWFVDGHNDELQLLNVSSGSISGTVYTHPAWQSSHEVLAAERRGEKLEVLRLVSDSPYEFNIDQFTCY